jgi:hypothetical protein
MRAKRFKKQKNITGVRAPVRRAQVWRTFPLEQLPEAFSLMLGRRVMGKVLLTPGCPAAKL